MDKQRNSEILIGFDVVVRDLFGSVSTTLEGWKRWTLSNSTSCESTVRKQTEIRKSITSS